MADVFIQSGTLAVGETPAPYLQGLYIPAIDSSGFTDGYKIVIPWGGGSTARAFPLDELLESAPDGMDTFLTALSGQLMSQAPAQTVYNFEGLVGPMGVPGPIGPQGIVIAAAPGPTSDWIVYDVSKPIFSSSIVFSDDYPSGDTDAVSWTAGSVKRGTSTYNVVAGNSDKEFIYWDQSDPYVFNGSDTRTDAVGVYKWFMGHNVNGTFYPVYGAKLYEGELLRDATIKANAIASLAIEEGKLAADAVTAAKLAVAGIDGTTGSIASNHIIAGMLQSNCVTSVKIQADAVTAAKINVVGLHGTDGYVVVTSADAANAVTGGINTYATTEISAGKIVISGATNLDDWAKTGDSTKIDGGKISTNTVTATQIAAGTITAAQIDAGTITANEIAGTTILAGNIKADAIETLKIKVGNVTTARVAADAISIRESATDSGTDGMSTAWGTIVSDSITSLGGLVEVTCLTDMIEVSSPPATVELQILRGATQIAFASVTVTGTKASFSLTALDSPGGGAVTYYFQGKENPSAAVNNSNKTIHLVEAKTLGA